MPTRHDAEGTGPDGAASHHEPSCDSGLYRQGTLYYNLTMQKLQSQLDAQRQKVDVDHFDLPAREILTMVEASELTIAPEYQRQFRWDAERESELIESLLLGLPVPPIFVATNSDATWELVDGLQRVSTLIHFAGSSDLIRDHLPGKRDALKLSGLDKLSAFNYQTFNDLPRPLQLAFHKRPIRVTALSDKSQLDVRFDLFERLNRGGVVLTPQEVRSCIYRGSFNDFLRELIATDDFRNLLKLQRGHASDGTAEEQVLKFFAYLEGRKKFDHNVTDFLNNFMQEHRETPMIVAWRQLFASTMKTLGKVFKGGPATRKGYGPTPLNQFEAIVVACAELLREGVAIKCSSTDLMDDAELVKFSTKGTNTRAALGGRIARARVLLTAS